MKALLSIKPEYVERILSGEKTYEFRRKIFKRSDVDTIVIYATRPQGAVVAEAPIVEVLEAEPQRIWERTHEHGGISKKSFMNYFRGSNCAYAIRLGKITQFDQPIPLTDYSDRISRPPQSFVYVN
ncbi:hypothetical protein KIM372_01100 [Bombiscardovia nodaiensis]|uniref:ASCH domain-containing protein n=1 Tax=Bombiscardovia nodaiensis TaxID=2932181 RepID=A0ABM8B5S2_9BIFI|nr:hypothetical protein KIM372_01100 [Bombiscardovia nodaiensis]